MNKMIKHFVLFFILLFFYTQSILAQKNPSEIKKQPLIAFDNKDYESAITLVNEMQSFYKEMPPIYLAIRIKSLNNIIDKDPYLDFNKIIIARKFISEFLENEKIKSQDKETYFEIEKINSVFELYPKDEISFFNTKESKQKEAELNKINAEKIAIENKEKEAKEANEANAKLEQEHIEAERLLVLKEQNRARDLYEEEKNKKKLENEYKKRERSYSEEVMNMGFSIYGGYNDGYNGGFDFLSPALLIGMHYGSSQIMDSQYGINTRSELALNLGFYLSTNKSILLKTGMGYTDLFIDYDAYPTNLDLSYEEWLIGFDKWSEKAYTKFYYKLGIQFALGKVKGSGFSPEIYFSNNGIGFGLGYVFCTSKK